MKTDGKSAEKPRLPGPMLGPPWLIDCLGAGVVVVDSALTVLGANRAAGELLGVGSGELVGRTIREYLERSEMVLARLMSSLRAGPGADGSSARAVARAVIIKRADRQVVVDLVAAALEPERDHTPAWAVLTILDATTRATIEAETARLRERLAESERARAKLSSLQAELVEAGPGGWGGAGPPVMIGSSAALRRVREQVQRVAPSDTTVLIQGETGSGKELVARSIHVESGRARAAFVAVNCAALPESLIESELFGHERGAFTGADRQRLGKFELADGGTLFLDEVAEMPLAAQAKLLRVLQEGTFERVGGTETVRVDVRVVAATHRDLARRVERGLFREDLFYRLNVFRIDVPPLRERREDLGALVEHLHEAVARRLARPVLPVSEGSMRRVMAYRWPGNVRELANAVERATLLADGPELDIELPESPAPGAGGVGGFGEGRAGGGASRAGGRAGAPGPTRDILLDLTLEQLQRLHIMHALETSGYRVFGPGGAGEKLDVNPHTLLSRMDRFGIPRPRLMRRAGSVRGRGPRHGA